MTEDSAKVESETSHPPKPMEDPTFYWMVVGTGVGIAMTSAVTIADSLIGLFDLIHPLMMVAGVVLVAAMIRYHRNPQFGPQEVQDS